jgi:hypothetical protein
MYLSAKYLDQWPFRTYGLFLTREALVDLLAGIVIAFLSVLMIFVSTSAMGILSFKSFNPTPETTKILLIILKVFLVGVWEECLFRGYFFSHFRLTLFNKMSANAGFIAAAFLSSILFSLSHVFTNDFSIFSFGFFILNGMVWCLLFHRTGGLAVVIGMHASWNFSQLEIFGFSMSGNRAEQPLLVTGLDGPVVWTGGNYGPEAGLLGLLGLLVMLLLGNWYVVSIRPKLTI